MEFESCTTVTRNFAKPCVPRGFGEVNKSWERRYKNAI